MSEEKIKGTGHPSVVICIPAYNEESRIGNIIKDIQSHYSNDQARGYRIDIIVVDDGSTDATAKEAKNLKVKEVISHPRNRGLGAAARTGLQKAYAMGSDVVVKIDADSQYDPIDIETVVRPILDGKADCVFGSRFMGGLTYPMPFLRMVGNKFFSWLVATITGLPITDSQTGIMALNKRYLEKFELVSDYNVTQQLILDSWGLGMRSMEVPVKFYRRRTGKSFISLCYPFKVVPAIIHYALHFNPAKMYFLFAVAAFDAIILLLMLFATYAQRKILNNVVVCGICVMVIQLIFFRFVVQRIGKKNNSRVCWFFL